jgi:deazaflavin-dependent oxidoreductase (nitroreductase family)
LTNASTTWLSSTASRLPPCLAAGPRPVASPGIDDEAFCYLTTTGRRTGRPHTIEIWYAVAPSGTTLYLLAGGRQRADWVRNLVADPEVAVRMGRQGEERPATGRVVDAGSAEDAMARRLMLEKYQAPGARDLAGWGRSALPVAIDLRPTGRRR